MKPILVVGETNVDVVVHAALPVAGREVLADDCVLTLGSASAICAMGLARLGDPVVVVSRVGADLWGDYCICVLDRAGIDTSHVARDPALKTGVTVSISGSGDRALVTYVGAIDTVSEADVPDALLAASAHLHVSSYFLQSRLRPGCARLFARAKAFGLSTSLDPGCDPHHEWSRGLRDALHTIDVFLPNEIEVLGVTGCADTAAALQALQDTGGRTIVKLGASGSMTLDGGRLLHVPGFQQTPVDTTGAGDSFNAGFLHAYLRGRPVRECLACGNACGALSTLALGGINAQPTADQMANLVRSALDERP